MATPVGSAPPTRPTEGTPWQRSSSARSAPSPTRQNFSVKPSTRPSRPTVSTGSGHARTTRRCSAPTAAPSAIADYAQRPRRRRRRRGRARDEVADLPGTARIVLGVQPRPGVVDTSRKPSASGHKLGFVTTTSQGNIDALLAALQPHISAEMFDLIVNGDSVQSPKPDRRGIRVRLADSSGADADSRRRDRRQRRRGQPQRPPPGSRASPSRTRTPSVVTSAPPPRPSTRSTQDGPRTRHILTPHPDRSTPIPRKSR